jgi:hypothetical protein
MPVVKFYAAYDNRFNDFEDWMSDKVPIIVATTESFGLGIVKPFVKFVIHADVPKDLRAYYQVRNQLNFGSSSKFKHFLFSDAFNGFF